MQPKDYPAETIIPLYEAFQAELHKVDNLHAVVSAIVGVEGVEGCPGIEILRQISSGALEVTYPTTTMSLYGEPATLHGETATLAQPPRIVVDGREIPVEPILADAVAWLRESVG